MCAEDGYRQGISISHQDLARRGRVESFLFKNFAQQTQRERICRVKVSLSGSVCPMKFQCF